MSDVNVLYTPLVKLASGDIVRAGWLPPRPDARDFTVESADVADELRALKIPMGRGVLQELRLPPAIDLRSDCSPVEDQKALGSCTANAAAGIVEYFEKRAFNEVVDASRLFIYKTTRDLMKVTGDTGAWLRTTMAALVYFGAPPEEYWPYTDASPDFDREPPAFVYELADNYEALKYLCHDPIQANVPGAQVLASVKVFLSARIPSMFGFWGFPSFEASNEKGTIPFPGNGEQAQWGHAIAAIGYDDAKEITNTNTHETTKGALLIRNSWGTSWGNAGYGWLPYKYVTSKYALDFWSLLSMRWVAGTEKFGLKS